MGRFFPSSSAASDSSDILEKNAILQGNTCKYKVRRLLGQGTFGSVVHCINLDSKVNVAVKVAKKEYDKMFTGEAAIVKKLNILDPDKNNLLKHYETFIYMDKRCIVMEKLDTSLLDLFKKRKWKPLPVASSRVILQQLLVALKALKSIGLIHTDIKLDNIMFVDTSKDPLRVKLIDFGCAHLPSKLQPGSKIQPLWYRAPEVMLGLPVNEAADMWSLACVAAILFTGKFLYLSWCEYEVMKIIVELNGQPDDHMLDDGMHTRKFFYKRKNSMSVWRLNTPVQYETITGITVKKSNISMKYACWDDLTQDHPQPKTNSEREDIRAFLSLLKRMLCVDPAKRITPTEGLGHRFITMRHLTDMPLSNRNIQWLPFRRKPCPPVIADVEIPNFVTSSEVLHFGKFSSSCENLKDTYIIYKPTVTADPHNKSADQPKDSTPLKVFPPSSSAPVTSSAILRFGPLSCRLENPKATYNIYKPSVTADPHKNQPKDSTPADGAKYSNTAAQPKDSTPVKVFPPSSSPSVTSSEILRFGTFSYISENSKATYNIHKPSVTADPHRKSAAPPKDSKSVDGAKDSNTADQPKYSASVDDAKNPKSAGQPTELKPAGKPKASQPHGKPQKSKPGCNKNQSKNGYNTKAVCNKSNKSNSHRNEETTHCTVKTKKTALKKIRSFFGRMK